jgi:hypothetical protein
MTKLQKVTASVIATSSLVVNAFLPVFATTTVQITGNGAGSDNFATVNQASTTTVTQQNVANVSNNIDADADTGENDANFNTGGTTTVSTGNASVTALVANDLNSNTADVDCCDAGSTEVLIDGNGAYSDNTVNLDKTTATALTQQNVANVSNNIDADADTGKNDANWNTGGDVTVSTGKATVVAGASTTANMNVAHVGPSLGGGLLGGNSVSLKILGNGSGSSNWISAKLAKATTVAQQNTANISNTIDADADSGKNDANYNTGGNSTIMTGNAGVTVGVDNMVNFNYADVNCGCDYGLDLKIAGNGASPEHEGDKEDGYILPWWWFKNDNTILVDLTSAQALGQGNVANLSNLLDDSDADTGNNDIKWSTGEPGGDPVIMTGNSDVLIGVSNSGNVNNSSGSSLPSFPGSFPWLTGWSWEMFWAYFHIG